MTSLKRGVARARCLNLFVPHRGKWRFIQRNFLNSRWISNLVVKRNSLNDRTKLKNEINEFDDDKLTKFAEQSMTKCCWWFFNSQDFSSNQFRNWRWPPSVLSLTKQGWPGPRDYYCECVLRRMMRWRGWLLLCCVVAVCCCAEWLVLCKCVVVHRPFVGAEELLLLLSKRVVMPRIYRRNAWAKSEVTKWWIWNVPFQHSMNKLVVVLRRHSTLFISFFFLGVSSSLLASSSFSNERFCRPSWWIWVILRVVCRLQKLVLMRDFQYHKMQLDVEESGLGTNVWKRNERCKLWNKW